MGDLVLTVRIAEAAGLIDAIMGLTTALGQARLPPASTGSGSMTSIERALLLATAETVAALIGHDVPQYRELIALVRREDPTHPQVGDAVCAAPQPCDRRAVAEGGSKPPASAEIVENPAAGGSPAPTAVKLQPPTAVWTEARCDVLRTGYPVGRELDALLKAINALPGRPVARHVIAIKASQLGLKRPQNKPITPAGARENATSSLPGRSDSVNITPAGASEDATYLTVLHWAGQRGLGSNSEGFELDQVNAKRVALGLLPFSISRFMPGRASP